MSDKLQLVEPKATNWSLSYNPLEQPWARSWMAATAVRSPRNTGAWKPIWRSEHARATRPTCLTVVPLPH